MGDMDFSFLMRPVRPKTPDFLQYMNQARSLRDLTDQRRIRELQLQNEQMDLERKRQQAEDERRLRQALATGGPIAENVTLPDLMRRGIPPALAIKLHDQLLQSQTAASTLKTAQLAQAAAQRKAEAEKEQGVADTLYGVRSIPDPEKRQAAMDILAMSELDPRLKAEYAGFTGQAAPEQPLGIQRAGQPTPLIEPEFRARYAAGYNPTQLQALLEAEHKAKAERTKEALDIRAKQLDQSIKTAPDESATQEEYRAWRESLPADIRARTPVQKSLMAIRSVQRMGLTAEQREPSGVGDWIRIATDPSSTPEQQKRADDALIKHGQQARQAAPQMILSADQKVGNEAKLRDDFRQESKNHITLRDAWGKIQGAAQSQTGAGDMSLIFAYMKILDPGSTVREGEYATAQNAGSIPERITAIYNRAIKGEKLDPNVRAQFVEEASKIYHQSEADHEKIRNIYRGIALRSNLDPDNVVVDYSPGIVPPKPAAPKKAAPQTGPAPTVPLRDVLKLEPGTIDNGYRFKGGDPAKKENWEKVK